MQLFIKIEANAILSTQLCTGLAAMKSHFNWYGKSIYVVGKMFSMGVEFFFSVLSENRHMRWTFLFTFFLRVWGKLCNDLDRFWSKKGGSKSSHSSQILKEIVRKWRNDFDQN